MGSTNFDKVDVGPLRGRAVIAVVDRGGRILGVRVKNGPVIVQAGEWRNGWSAIGTVGAKNCAPSPGGCATGDR